MNECKQDGCAQPKGRALGYCNAHYLRQMRGRDMTKPVRDANASDSDRFWAKVDKSSDCWMWTAATIEGGYGVFRINGGNVVAHRVSYMWSNGPIPRGYEVDHMCFNRSCVNPSHLRLLSHSLNGQNRVGANANSRSGVRGVYRAQGQWIARGMIDRIAYEVGRFADLAEAEKAVSEWRREHMPASIQDQRRVA